MTQPGGSRIFKTAVAVGGMGITALAALAVGGPLAAVTVAVAGRALGEALGESGKELTKSFMEKATEYFFDTTGEPIINGFRIEHPTLEDIYRRAFRLSLASLKPAALDAKSMKKNRSAESQYDWFGYWDSALDSDIPFAAGSMKLPMHQAEVSAAFKTALEILAAQGAQQLERSTSILMKTESLPGDLFSKLKVEMPDKLDYFFQSLLVKEENTTAYKERDLAFKRQFLSSFAELHNAVLETKDDTGAIRAKQEEDGQKLDAILRMLGERLDAGLAAGTVPESALRERDALITRQAEELETLRKQLSARGADPSKAESKDAEISNALATGNLDDALSLQRQQTLQGSANHAQELFTLGKIHELRFEWSEALAAYRQAWEMGRDPEQGFYYARFASNLNHFSEAITAYENLLKAYEEPDDVTRTLNNLAILYSDVQRMQEAERAHDEALVIRRGLAEANPDVYLSDVATTLNNVANLYRITQRMQEAERAYDEALGIYRKLAEANLDAYLPYVPGTLNNLAILYSDIQRTQEAERAYDEALAIYRRLAEANPDAYLPYVARTLNNLAVLYCNIQRMQAAERPFDEALAIYRRLAEANPHAYLPDIAMTLNNLAAVYRTTQCMLEAERAYDEAFAIYRRLAETNPDAYLPDVAMTLNNVANLYSDIPRMQEAERAYDEALGIYRKLAEPNPDAYLPYVAGTLNNLANLYSDIPRMQEAERAYDQALAIYSRLAKANPHAYLPYVAKTLNNLSYFYYSNEQLDVAEARNFEAETTLDPFWQPNSEVHGSLMAKIFWTHALIREARKNPTDACAIARRALAAAWDPSLKESIQQLIARLCPPSNS